MTDEVRFLSPAEQAPAKFTCAICQQDVPMAWLDCDGSHNCCTLANPEGSAGVVHSVWHTAPEGGSKRSMKIEPIPQGLPLGFHHSPSQLCEIAQKQLVHSHG